MKKPKAQSITSLEQSPDAERRTRMIKYTVAMSIRMLCFISFFFLKEWWQLLIVGVGAVVLPYIGVVIANNVVRAPQSGLVSPGTVEPYRGNGPL